MPKVPVWARLTRGVLLVCLPIVLLFTPLYVFVTPAFVHHEYRQSYFPAADRFGTTERQRLSDVLVGYLRGDATLEQMTTLLTDSGDVAMRSAEVEHMVNVKQVMDVFFWLHGIAAVLAVAALVALGFRARAAVAPALRRAVWISGAIIVFIVAASLINFDSFFVTFHELLFPGGNWTFYYDDTLIQLYPLRLWIDAVWKMGAMIGLELVVVWVSAWLVGRKRAVSQ